MPTFPAICQPRLLAIVSLALLWVVSSCGGSQENIVGKWHATGDSSSMVWEFSEDSSVLMGSTRGKYTFGRNRVKIQTPFGTTVYQLDLLEDRMILRAPGGSKLEFTRSK